MNGLWLESDHDIPLIHVRWILEGGSADDARAHEGLTNFALESVRRGSPSRGRRETARYLAGVCTNLQIQVTPAHSQVSAMVPAGMGIEFARRLADVVREAAPDKEQIGALRRELTEGFEVSLENPGSRASLLFRRLMFGGDAWGNIPTGTRESLESVGEVEIRDRLRQVLAGGRTLALGGDIDDVTAAAMAEILLDGQETAKEGGAWPDTDDGRLALWHDPSQRQATVILGWLSERWDSDMFVSGRMVEKVLCGEFSSHLCQDFRQRAGLTYGIYGSHAVGARGAWFRLRFGTASEKAPQFLRDLLGALEVFGRGEGRYSICSQDGSELTRDVAFDADTVASCRKRTLNSLPFRFHTPRARLARRLEHELYGAPPPELGAWRGIAEQVTSDTLTRLARQLFAGRHPRVAIVDNMEINGDAYRELLPGAVLTEGDAGLCGQTSSV